MMRVAAFGFLLLLASCPALGCTCESYQQPLCTKLRSYKGSALFLGMAQKIESQTVVFGNDKVRMQVVTFLVEESLSGIDGKTVTVTSFTTRRMCGYRFRKAVRYLVDASETADSTYLTTAGRSGFRSRLDVNSCGMTAPADYASDSIRFLRTVQNNPNGAIVFGTVKQYGKGSTFVSSNNKAVSGSSVLLQALPDALLQNETREAPVDSSGYYEFVGLPGGVYTHTVSVPVGLTGVLQHTVELQSGGCAQLDVRVQAHGQ